LAVLRQKIHGILESSGFSVEIYEEDSTPSSEPATYLRDIEHADFVIFVLDDTYGTPRPSTGRSGVHEEWNIVKAKRIPNHVYLLRARGADVEPEQQKFIKRELQEREISYFYYANEVELRKQIRKSIVKMTLDIARSPYFRSHISRRSLAGEVASRDHTTFYRWDRAIALVAGLEQREGCLTTGWSLILDIYEPFSVGSVRPFIDRKAQEFFEAFLAALAKLSEYESTHVDGYSGEIGAVPFPVEPQMLHRLRICRPPDEYSQKVDVLKSSALEAWRKLGVLIAERYSRFADL